ncbi:MAG TPA: hypothetical protein VIM89_13520 [Mucilaginibacter sp.]
MDDPLDNDLKKRIREVFDDYDDGHADEGWQLLREKYPEKARRSPVLWLWWGSAAAVLLLFLGILWLNKKPEKENKLVGNKPGINHPIVKSIEPQKNSNTITNKNHNASDASADSVINSLQTQKLAENKLRPKRSHKSNLTKANKPSTAIEVSNAIANNNNISNKRTAGNNEPAVNNNQQKIAAINPAKTPEKQNIDIVTKRDNTAKFDSSTNVTTQSMAVAKPNNGVNMLNESKQPNKAVFADNEVPKNKKERGLPGRAVSFGVYAATYVNYASKSNNQVNEGIGISSDIRISRKLNLSTGVAIGQNSLNYNGQLPPEQSKLLASTNNSANNDKISALAPTAYNPSSNSYFAATPSLKNYTASLVGLEIPINLKYKFNPEKSATFVSIGVSSGTFINETYTSTYAYTTPFASNLSQTTDQSLQQKFNSFYFAKTLNFSFGTGYRISGNDLIIEPFIKYPIEGLGSQQIKFGSGGVNLKFNFQGGRRK